MAETRQARHRKARQEQGFSRVDLILSPKDQSTLLSLTQKTGESRNKTIVTAIRNEWDREKDK